MTTPASCLDVRPTIRNRSMQHLTSLPDDPEEARTATNKEYFSCRASTRLASEMLDHYIAEGHYQRSAAPLNTLERWTDRLRTLLHTVQARRPSPESDFLRVEETKISTLLDKADKSILRGKGLSESVPPGDDESPQTCADTVQDASMPSRSVTAQPSMGTATFEWLSPARPPVYYSAIHPTSFTLTGGAMPFLTSTLVLDPIHAPLAEQDGCRSQWWYGQEYPAAPELLQWPLISASMPLGTDQAFLLSTGSQEDKMYGTMGPMTGPRIETVPQQNQALDNVCPPDWRHGQCQLAVPPDGSWLLPTCAGGEYPEEWAYAAFHMVPQDPSPSSIRRVNPPDT